MGHRFLWLVMLSAVGCTSKSTPDARVRDAAVERSSPDQAVADVRVADRPNLDGPRTHSIGELCKTSDECHPKSPLCLIVDTARQIGVCTTDCVPDDPTTPLLSEDNCPKGTVCSVLRDPPSKDRYLCLRRCTPSLTVNPCPTGSRTTCHPASITLGASTTVCYHAACTSGQDCPVLSSISCSARGQCTALGADAFCDPSSKRCARPGICGASGLCAPHGLGNAQAKVGAPCSSDFDCPKAAFCALEPGGGSPKIRNGYCTIPWCDVPSLPEFACPVGSACHRGFTAGRCHKTCDPAKAGDCRGAAGDVGGDYDCYAWNRLSIRGELVTPGPVCQAAISCDSIATKINCPALGSTSANPLKMSCRDRITGAVLADPRDPAGVCLDDTASGSFADAGIKADAATKIDVGIKADAGVKADAAKPDL